MDQIELRDHMIPKNNFNNITVSNEDGEDQEIQIPTSCDVKEALIVKLEELDNQIHHLLESNQFFESGIAEARVNGVDEEDYDSYADMEKEYKEFIKENAELIRNKKNTVIRILTAFIKAGSNLDRDVFPKLKYKSEYMPAYTDGSKKDHYAPTKDEQLQDNQNKDQVQQTLANLHQATTFNQVVNIEAGNQPSKTEEVKQNEDPEPDQIDSSSKNTWKYQSNNDPIDYVDDDEEDQMPESISDMIKKTNDMTIEDSAKAGTGAGTGKQREEDNPLTEVYI